MTMGQRDPAQNKSLEELIELVLQDAATDRQRQQLQARLLDCPEDRLLYLHRLNLHSALRRQFAFDTDEDSESQPDAAADRPGGDDRSKAPRARRAGRRAVLLATAVAIAAVLVAGMLWMGGRPKAEIATITEVNGALQWTGDGGRVVRDPQAGSRLRGGTLESLSADSWAVLTFRDGSTVTVSGPSMLTISDDPQKEIHLREGSLSASIVPQPRGRPMLIHTPTAELEVLGTQLNVDAGRTSTTLRVNEGRVRVTRLADGVVAEVPADHQVVVSASRRDDLQVRRRPESVRSWQSVLPAGAIYGEWTPEGERSGGILRTAPMLLNFRKEPTTLHLAAVSVSRCPAPPVMLTPGGKFLVRGRMERSGKVYFGLTTKHVKGGFAGKYIAARQIDLPAGRGQPLEIELRVEQFRPQEREFADSPAGLELVDWWCFTYNVDTGLGIAGVELLPASPSQSARRPATEPAELPIMDLWTAASQGNLEAVKRHLAAGAEIDATFVAPGIPASGATPLHLAVLCDQGEVARFLIQRRANLDARARDEHGGTPLHWAAALGRVEMARCLIEAGADVNARDRHGFTPLDATHYDREAAKEAKRQIAELLRSKGGRSKPRQGEEPGA